MGQGPGGPLGPSYRIRMESVTTYCQAGYLLSGRLSAAVRDAPNNSIHAPKSFRIHAPNNRILARKSFCILCTQAFLHTCTQNPHTCTQKFPHTCILFRIYIKIQYLLINLFKYAIVLPIELPIELPIALDCLLNRLLDCLLYCLSPIGLLIE